MAYPSPILSAGRTLAALMTQALGTMSVRAFASNAAAGAATSSSNPPPPPKRQTSIVEPTYTYMPPGSSMREPLYFSTSDPVYFVDPKPDPQASSQAQAGRPQAPADEEKAAIPKAQSHAHEPASVRKIDFSSISGKQGDDGRQVSYKMVDDMSQQPYIVNPNTHSMREPKYVSVSDPKYAPADKPKQ